MSKTNDLQTWIFIKNLRQSKWLTQAEDELCLWDSITDEELQQFIDECKNATEQKQ